DLHAARNHPRRHVIQKALGGGNQFVEPQVGAAGCERGDIFLLCSDGLTEGLYDHHIIDLLRQTSRKPNANAAQALVDASLQNDGRDNTTALVVQII
ncbi:MAG TPA: serine/threonine-protein phosphatase, partial [Verrucomicrobiae bacterium]